MYGIRSRACIFQLTQRLYCDCLDLITCLTPTPTHTHSPTSDDLSAVWLRLQEAEERFGLVRAVHTCLHGVLQHCVHRAGPEMIRQLQHQLPVQMWAALAVLIHVHAHWRRERLRCETRSTSPSKQCTADSGSKNSSGTGGKTLTGLMSTVARNCSRN